MTTIAYKDGVLAFDSRVTEDDVPLGTVRKGIQTDRFLAAAAGDLDIVHEFLKWIADDLNPPKKPKLGKGEDFTGWVIDSSGRLTEYSKSLKPVRYSAEFYSIGSGANFAKGAMAAGSTAKEAVTIAAKFDPATGGDIHELQVSTLKVKRGKKETRSRR